MTTLVELRTTASQPKIHAAAVAQVLSLLIEIRPGASAAQLRMPLGVAFVLDRSGSMAGAKIRHACEALKRAVGALAPDDMAAVISFERRTRVDVPLETVGDGAAICRRIDKIRADGGTRMAPAMSRALEQLGRSRAGLLRRMILLTDGQTEGEDDCLAVADEAGRQQVSITALGLGRDWNEDLLIELGNRSSGTADAISAPEQIDGFFAGAVRQAQSASIQRAVLTLRTVQGVSVRAAWQVVPLITQLGVQPTAQRDVTVPLGEVDAATGRAVLVELLIEPRAAGTYRVATAEIQCDVPLLGQTDVRERAEIVLEFTADAAAARVVNPTVMNVAEKVSAFRLQTRALADLAAGDVAAATNRLQSAVTRLLSQGEAALAQQMQQEVDRLRQGGQLSSDGQKTMKFGTSRTVRLTPPQDPADAPPAG
jgi:Ca-activated chloride channel family protein